MTDARTLIAQIEAALAALDFPSRPASLYAPMRYVTTLKAKRIRPLLTLWTYQAVSGAAPQAAMSVALAVEIFHNFTLVHDDVMDAAPTRRGLPTVHVKWDANTAILAGDGLFAYAMQLIAESSSANVGALCARFASVALEVCEGQALDMETAAAETPSESPESYFEMIEKKTGALVGGAFELGALAAEAPENLVAALGRYGRAAGVCFQLLDDLLDVYAESEAFGKQPGGDIIENKQTFLWSSALASASDVQKAALLYWRAKHDAPQEKVAAVKAIFDELNIENLTRTRIETDYAAAVTALAPHLEEFPDLHVPIVFLSNVLQRKS